MGKFYKFLMILLTPFFYVLLWRRVNRGKEIPERIGERLGKPSQPRKKGTYLWVHAASVGESLMILPFIEKISQAYPSFHFLMTTATASAARLLEKRLPSGVVHQFLPIDQPYWVERFLSYWEPSLILWAESEFWPSLFLGIRKRKIPLFVINGGVSQASLQKWRFASSLIRETLQATTLCFARSVLQFSRLQALGAPRLKTLGNVKFSVSPLKYSQKEFQAFKNHIGSRPVWVAASTHEGEEREILKAHQIIKQSFPNLLTILVPRHPSRTPFVLKELEALYPADRLMVRSHKSLPTVQTEIYMVDTIGELGLFYSLAPVCFIGGSFIPQGGHNLIEPLQLGCIPLYGPHMENFQEVLDVLQEEWFGVRNGEELASKVLVLLGSQKIHEQYLMRMKNILKKQEEMGEKIIQTLSPYLKGLSGA